jgi:outer membrane protein
MTRMLITFLLILAGTATAETRTLDLKDCIRLGLTNNLKLQNAKLQAEMVGEGISAARARYDSRVALTASKSESDIPEPGSFFDGHREVTDARAELSKSLASGTRLGLSAGLSELAIETPDTFSISPYSAGVSFTLSQSLLKNAFGDLDRATVRSAEYRYLMATSMYRREIDLLTYTIEKAYWTLFAARANHTIGTESLALARTLLTTNRKRFEDGLLDETDVLSAEAVIATREAELISLRNRVDRATDQLAHIIQLPRSRISAPTFVYPDALLQIQHRPTHQEALYKLALANRADLISFISAAQRAESDVKAKKSATKPDLSIFGSLDKGSSDTSRADSLGVNEDGWTVGVKFETTLSRTAEKGALRNAEREFKKAANDVADMKAAIDYECRSASRVLNASLEQVSATKRATRLRERRLKLEQDKFDQGRSDTRWVVQAQDELILSRMAHQLSLANSRKAEAASRAAAGLGAKGGKQ